MNAASLSIDISVSADDAVRVVREALAQERDLNAAVERCALAECKRQERAALADQRQNGRVGINDEQPRYFCPVCRDVVFGSVSAAALYVHLLDCPAYRADITPDFMRPMGAAEPAPTQCDARGGAGWRKRCHLMAGHTGDHQFNAEDVRSAAKDLTGVDLAKGADLTVHHEEPRCPATQYDGGQRTSHCCVRRDVHKAHECVCGYRFLVSDADLRRAEHEVKRPVEREP